MAPARRCCHTSSRLKTRAHELMFVAHAGVVCLYARFARLNTALCKIPPLMLAGPSSIQRASVSPPRRRRQQRHIYLEGMGSVPLKIMLLTMIVTAVGCIVLSVMQSKSLSEIVGDDEQCIRQLGKELCITQFEPLNCTPPNSSFVVPPSNFKGRMTGISPYNRYFAIDTRFLSPNANTTRRAQELNFPRLTFNMTVLANDGQADQSDVVFEVKSQM